MTRRLRSPGLFYFSGGDSTLRTSQKRRQKCLPFFLRYGNLALTASLTLLTFYTNFQMDHYDDNNDAGSDDRDDRPPPSSGGAGAVV